MNSTTDAHEFADSQGMVEELRNAAERVVADHADHLRTRRLRRTLPGYDANLLDLFVELGWFGVLVPEEEGGIGLGLPEMSALIRALEKGLLSEPLLPIAVLGARVLVHGDGQIRSELLGGMLTGNVRPALALDFGDRMPEVTEEGGLLSGKCTAVAGSAAATHFLIPARGEDGVLALHAVAADAAGLTLGHRWRADEGPVGHISLAGVESLGLVATSARAQDAIATAIDETRLVAAAGLVGISEHVLDLTIEYLKVRKQFGVAIGSFQALKHKAVDLYIQKEIAVATVGFGHAHAAAGDLVMGALRAKGRASLAANRIARECLHLHGAIGYTDEHDIGLYLKRALSLSAWLGNGAEHRRRYREMGQVLS